MDVRQKRALWQSWPSSTGSMYVAVGAPVPTRRQERARAMCLERLVTELHGYGVTDMMVESRTPSLDARDVTTVIGARHNLPKGSSFRIDHEAGKGEPLFWAADIVAGAVRAHRQGDSICHAMLTDCLYEIAVPTRL
ncbi:MAG: hypothetical protein M3443_08890 [Actinomycetota bacterium]|nr:hypothetical protein [Actinomycetota bacterium]